MTPQHSPTGISKRNPNPVSLLHRPRFSLPDVSAGRVFHNNLNPIGGY